MYLPGCSAAGPVARFCSNQANIQKVTDDGCVVLESGEKIRLAGIRMRPVVETQEPELIDVVSNLVRLHSSRVRVVEDRETKTAVVYYSQVIYHQPHYVIPYTIAMRVLRPTTSATINELLIFMAAARYDPSVGFLPEKASRDCERAAQRADAALWGSHTYRPLQKYKFGGGSYVNDTGFRARITQGDIAARDRNLEECRAKTQALGRQDVREWEKPMPGPAIEDVPKLVEALADENRCVRRFVAHTLRKLGAAGRDTAAVPALIRALGDDDCAVRAAAAWALGEIGAVEATAALTLAKQDDCEAVRDAAARALRQRNGA